MMEEGRESWFSVPSTYTLLIGGSGFADDEEILSSMVMAVL